MSNPNTNLDSLLDGTLDDLADATEFRHFPAGIHRVQISAYGIKNNGGNNIVEIKLRAIETIELADPESDTPLTAGTETSVGYFVDLAVGQGNLKKILKVAAEHFGAKSVKELLNDLVGTEVTVVTTASYNKAKTAVYTNIEDMRID